MASAAGNDESQTKESRAQDKLAAGRLNENRGMGTPSPQKRSAELRERIEKANYEHHVLDQPTIADQPYDALMRELQDLEGSTRSSSRRTRRNSGSARLPQAASRRSNTAIR